MTQRCESHSATLLDVLGEVSALLGECSQIAGQLEQAIGDWLSESGERTAFPVRELQGIDLLRQIQHDLATLLASEELAQEIVQNRNRVNLASVVGTPKLERVRARLMQLAKGRLDPAEAAGPRHAAAEVGGVDLF